MILDLSDAGLAMQCPAALEVSCPAEVEFAGIGRPVVVQVLIWNQRRIRHRRGESFAYGCIVEEPGADFLDLLPEGMSNRTSATEAAGADPRKQEQLEQARADLSEALDSSAADIEPRRYRVRVRERSSSRTKTLTLVAADEAEARAAGQASLGEGWDLLEVLPARKRAPVKRAD